MLPIRIDIRRVPEQQALPSGWLLVEEAGQQEADDPRGHHVVVRRHGLDCSALDLKRQRDGGVAEEELEAEKDAADREHHGLVGGRRICTQQRAWFRRLVLVTSFWARERGREGGDGE